MSRLDNLAENKLRALLEQAERELREMKAPQIVGSHNVIMQRVFSGDPFDIEVSGLTVLTGYTVEVVFTPDDSTFENLGLVYKMEYAADISNNPNNLRIDVERQKPDNNQQRWLVFLSSTAATSYVRLRFYFFANGPGTFTATLV
ncbi:hypothetical protein ACSCB1_35435 [Streptomyces europaeiscabiei]|uniref:hypothetical protein n=1 Tax=Streptomyces europaeiscabiei TaxID=146819 RepID=UPI000A83300D|nr:hypothetical protein [Streptomyces europaeiscabiei]